MPVEVIEQLKHERELFEAISKTIKDYKERNEKTREFHRQYFQKFDALLDGHGSGPTWLKEPAIASIVHEALLFRDGKQYDLFASCIMPNHFHMVIELLSQTVPLFRVLQTLKGYPAWQSNNVLGRRGPFWQDESYDHVIREGEELERMIWYVIENPVKAGLVSSWEQWPWTYVKEDLL